MHYRGCCMPPAAAPAERRFHNRRLLPPQVAGAAARQPSLQAQHAAGRPRRPLLQRLNGDVQRLVALPRPIQCRCRLQQTLETVPRQLFACPMPFSTPSSTLAHFSNRAQCHLIRCLHDVVCSDLPGWRPAGLHS